MELDAVNFWYKVKEVLREAVGLSSEQAHVHAGIALFLIFALMFRRYRHGLLFALVAIFVLQTINEMMDARDWIIWTGGINWAETIKDYAATLFWPAVLCVTLKHVMPDAVFYKRK